MKKILFLAALALLASCQKNDDDTSQDEDRKEQNKALQNELTSNKDGWKLTYIAEDGSTGGYQFLMKYPRKKWGACIKLYRAKLPPPISRCHQRQRR